MLTYQASKTEDAIAIYSARLAILSLLHTAPKGAVSLDVDLVATVLRPLLPN